MKNILELILNCLMAFAAGLIIGPITGSKMPALKLSWTWGLVGLFVAFVLLPSFRASAPLEIFVATASVMAILAYLVPEFLGRRERGKDLITPWNAVRDRAVRTTVTGVIIATWFFGAAAVYIVVSIVVLVGVWCWYEKDGLRAILADLNS